MKHTHIAAGLAVLLMMLGGCKTDELNLQVEKSTNTYAVVVGLNYSKYVGECPGAGYDAERMRKLLSNYTPNVAFFLDANATKAKVSAALREAVAKAGNGLVIFTYSGHGGSDKFPNTGSEEVDGKDEFLCLYDTWMRDNEIWQIVSKSTGRVMMFVDACHSQTMMRDAGFRMRIPLAWDHTLDDKVDFSLLCWSGCPDASYSYGSAGGGMFSNAFFRHFNANKTYEELWKVIKNNQQLRLSQDPQSTVLGNGFENKPIFK